MSEPIKDDLSELLRKHWDRPPAPSAKLRAQVLASIEVTPLVRRSAWLSRIALATAMAAALAVGWHLRGDALKNAHDSAAALRDGASLGLSLGVTDNDSKNDENDLYDIAATVAASD